MAQLKTSPDEDTGLGYVPSKLADKPGLADSGLSTEQDDRRPIPCRVEYLQKAFQLSLAPNECRRGDTPRHVGQYPSPPAWSLDCG